MVGRALGAAVGESGIAVGGGAAVGSCGESSANAPRLTVIATIAVIACGSTRRSLLRCGADSWGGFVSGAVTSVTTA